ncbi:hypothetical protein ACQ4LE_007641 [Meloidogyne hapla]|uniref:Uncharacterized protein n=1 Tax=Meloidogyne hapla TaxID=6305 RepID=A0A1I8B7V9_MELHA
MFNGTEDMAGVGMCPPVSERRVDVVDIPESQVESDQQQSGCKIQMAGESGNAGYHQCTLQSRAKDFIHDVIERRNGLEIQNGYVTTNELSILSIKKSSRAASELKSVGKGGDMRLTAKTVSKIQEKSMPKTPDHYWDVDFPSLNEQLERGYITHTNSPLFKKQCNRPKRCLFRE